MSDEKTDILEDETSEEVSEAEDIQEFRNS